MVLTEIKLTFSHKMGFFVQILTKRALELICNHYYTKTNLGKALT